ncbi:DUF2244 domain-containing protein [Rhodobacteraceae bacterium NNCM2]|nr:DUF2244 domain-containing protein [Coraliihabitans acroporae]
MSATEENSAAGGKPPAVRASGDWVDWRERHDKPIYSVTLWPHRSMSPRLRKRMIGLAAIGLSIPLIPAWGTPVFWGLLPFLAGALGLLWLGFRSNDRSGMLREELTIWRDEMRVERYEPKGRVRRWSADPFRVRLIMHEDGRPENYLTIRGGTREIELGAFLAPWERQELKEEVDEALARAFRP